MMAATLMSDPSPPLYPGGPPQPGAERRRQGEGTHSETYYYVRQVDSRAPLLFHLRDGETLHGTLAWYDRGALRVDLLAGGHRILQKRALLGIADLPAR